MIADMINNKNLNPVVTELSIVKDVRIVKDYIIPTFSL